MDDPDIIFSLYDFSMIVFIIIFSLGILAFVLRNQINDERIKQVIIRTKKRQQDFQHGRKIK